MLHLNAESWKPISEKVAQTNGIMAANQTPDITLDVAHSAYDIVVILRNRRNKLIKHQLSLFEHKAPINSTFKHYKKDYEKRLVNLYTQKKDELTPFKAKADKDAYLEQFIPAEQGLSIWEGRKYSFDSAIEQIRLAIGEHDQLFKELELLYNITRLEGLGQLINQSKYREC